MKIAITGSIAWDHLMAFPGRFTDHIVPGRLDSLSLSFLVEEVALRPGGVAANIAFGLGSLGVPCVLVGCVGQDFDGYRQRLESRHVDTGPVRVSADHTTARFLCTTDAAHNQIASFCPGAMVESKHLRLGPVAERAGGLDLIVIGPNDPGAMLGHTEECRARRIAFAADPSQQLASLDEDAARSLVEGACCLFTNEYEHELLLRRTGWSHGNVLDRVGYWVTTFGRRGVRVERRGRAPVMVPAVTVASEADPTGVGDAFRAGFLWGLYWRVGVTRAAQVGCTLASFVLEHPGGQEYTLDRTCFSSRVAAAYGAEAAGEVEAKLRI